ncbi:MAG: ABC-F family ATP-binding cassette domain-containing protein [Halobacteriovoraceae bacterium]|nr:ABC-F family ATP-binding cassette domain-containing protein [Halobacteriovoraceae bacterium]
MIKVFDLTKSFGKQELFSQVSFLLNSGERVGLVGRNGTGKSTLFKIIAGEMTPDEGEVVIPKNYKIGILKQHINFNRATVLQECVDSLPEDQKYDQYKVEKILLGLGLDNDDILKNPYDLSGGLQLRVSLAKVLLQAPNLLLLDEPTNYLDILGIRWLENFLKKYPGEMIIITHDRTFMDAVITHTMGIKRGLVKKIKGDTEKYYEQITQEEIIHEQTRLNLERKKKHLEDFITRFKAKASKATQAKSKQKKLDKLGALEKLSIEKNFGPCFQYTPCPSKYILEVKDLFFSYPNGPELLGGLSFSLKTDDCLAIIGPNGKGKSTLLNLLANNISPNTGEINFHSKVQQGFFGQTNIERLFQDNSIIQEIQNANSDLSISQVRSICGHLMFEGDLAEKKISVLSGGERSRVLLGKILAYKTNMLLMDEPTNHLDIESVQSLINQLEIYEGAVLLVSHDEKMIRSLATKLIVFQDNRVEFFDGDYDHFLEKIGWIEPESEDKKSKNSNKKSKKEIKYLREEIISQRSKELNPLKKRVEKLEEHIFEYEDDIKSLELLLMDSSLARNPGKISEIAKDLGQKKKKLEEFYEEFEEKSVLLEDREKFFENQLNDLCQISVG